MRARARVCLCVQGWPPSQVRIVGPPGERRVDGSGPGALGPREGDVVVQRVPDVRHAAGRRTSVPAQRGHVHASRLRFRARAEAGAPGLLHPHLAAVLPAAAATDTDEHDETAQDLENAADETQHDAVAHAHGLPRRHRVDVLQDVGVPRDGDEDKHPRDED